MRAIKMSPGRAPRRTRLSQFAATIQPAKEAAVRLKQRVGRFAAYDFLEAIYRVHIDWKCRKIANRSAQTLANELSIVRRKGMSTIRILIEAVLPEADFKQKSRWVRALEYVYSENVLPTRFRKFVRTSGGVAGCARLAVHVSRKRRRPGGDWID